ncbi:MAG: YggS family pyridoxal phosphate-dependent enzyme [Bdellovibrionales bacterium]|nr:YggS family pyridoxal phosphate-dependent enzyme [Bdellovibrionales bacterium]
MVGSLKSNLEKVKKNIQENLPSENVEPRIIAVSKRQDEQKVRDMHQLGVKDFAENYWQEAKDKIENLKDLDICWHYIGQLQKKKVKDIVGRFEFIHSLDRADIAEKMSDKCSELGIEQKVLIQVNIAGEMSKLGLKPEEALIFVHKLSQYKNLKLCGLMIFPPLCKTDEDNLHWFHEGKKLFDLLREHCGEDFQHLSMGTSQNYYLAVREGANMLRIGESLMGVRL